ncbi:MAG: hypothetical protein ABEI13_02660 [Candidatus Paceibacteria bacterium]
MNFTRQIIQIDLIFDYFPPWLGITLILAGIAALLIHIPFAIEYDVHEWNWDDLGILYKAGYGVIVAGIVMIFRGIYLKYPDFMIVPVLLLAKYLEGITAVRFYQKAAYIIRNRTLPSQHIISFKSRIGLELLSIFIFLISGWIIILLTVTEQFRAYWTISTAIISLSGLLVKFSPLQKELSILTVIGASLIIAGSEVHNLQSIRIDILVLLFGILAYSFGYWISAYRYVKNEPFLFG